MADEKKILDGLRKTVEGLTETAQNIVNLNKKETQSFGNREILEEIGEDEELVENFVRNLNNLENHIDEAIHKIPKIDNETREELWNDIMTISEETLHLVETYENLPEHVAKAGIQKQDSETANSAIVYYLRLEHVLDLTEDLAEMEAEESALDEIRGIKRPQEKLRQEKGKLEKERQKIETEKIQTKQKLKSEGLLAE